MPAHLQRWKHIRALLLLFALLATTSADNYEDLVLSIFKVQEGQGVMLFNTTSTDDAPFMSIPSMLGNQPATPSPAAQPSPSTTQAVVQAQAQQERQLQLQKPNQYSEYKSLSHQPQSFKVQRSPDGKLNLVFNDPLVSLQRTQGQQPHVQPVHQHRIRQPSSDTFIFPDQIAKFPTLLAVGDHQCADGFNQSRSFCSKLSNYPDLSGIKGTLAQKYASFFSDDPPVGIRMTDDDDDQYLCGSNVRYFYPEGGQSVDSSWKIIVNTKEFKQGILIEECEHEGDPCRYTDSFANNYMPICKQHYVYRHLVTVNVNGSKPDVSNTQFKIPSCCKCALRVKASGASGS